MLENFKMIAEELNRLKSLLLQKNANETIITIDAIIKNINTTAEYSPSPSELKFAYSRLQAVRHSAELLHGIDVKSDSENYKKIKAIMQATPETIGAHETLATTSDATVIDPPVDDLQKEKELHEEQEKLRDNTEFLTLLRASNLHTIQTKTATKKIFISYAWPGQPRWYTAENMQLLLAHYCSHNKKIVPIQFDDLHWALIYIDPLANAFFIDPLASDINPDLRTQYPNISIPKHLVCKEKSYDTGPWLVEVARLITEQDKLPDIVPSIKDARETHATVVASLKRSDASNELEKKFDEPWTKEFVKQLAIHLTIAGFQVYLDELHSCDGYPLAKFMKKIKKVDHVLLISTRTMGHKLGFKESGVRFELQQALEASSGKIGKRFFIPILLNNTPHYASEIKSLGLAEVSMCQNGYFNSLRDLITRLYYGVHSVDFSNFWLDTWLIENIKQYYIKQKKAEIPNDLTDPIDIKKPPICLTPPIEKEQPEKQVALHDPRRRSLAFYSPYTQRSFFENSHSTTQSVNVEDAFESDAKKADEAIKRILILGNTATEKSTLCHNLAYLWAKGLLWNNKFRLLLWIPLRELVTLSDDEATLNHFITEKYSSKNHAGENMFTPEQARSLLDNINPNTILFILDGADEISERINELPEIKTRQGNLIRYLFSEHTSHVIITACQEKYIYLAPNFSVARHTLMPWCKEGCFNSRAFRESLVKHYKSTSMNYFPFNGRPIPLEDLYVNLAILNKSNKTHNQPVLNAGQTGKSHDAFLDAHEKMYHTETNNIQPENIFKHIPKNEKQKTNRVTILGRPGVGKSTCCQYIKLKWSEGKIWQEYDFLFYIPLRRLLDTVVYPPGIPYTLLDLVLKEIFQLSVFSEKPKFLIAGLQLLLSDNKKIVWLLDGYDEIANSYPEYLASVIDELMHQPNLVVTSRPYFTGTLEQDVLMEIMGFTDENIEQYVRQRVQVDISKQLANTVTTTASNTAEICAEIKTAPSDEKQIVEEAIDNILDTFKKNTNIWGLSHIPVNLALICELTNDSDYKFSSDILIHIGSLYYQIDLWLRKRFLTRDQKQALRRHTTRPTHIIQNTEHIISVIAKLAWETMCNETLIVPAINFKETIEQLDKHDSSKDWLEILLNIGILTGITSNETLEEDKQYYFLHLTFQEYYAAYYLYTTIKSMQTLEEPARKDILAKNTGTFRQVWIFLISLLGRDKTNINLIRELITIICIFGPTIDYELMLELINVVNKELYADLIIPDIDLNTIVKAARAGVVTKSSPKELAVLPGSGMRPLHIAAEKGLAQVITWLKLRGADMQLKGNIGNTPLLVACYYGHINVAEELMGLGATLKERNRFEGTPLIVAADGQQLQMVKWLVKKGCKLEDKDNLGNTAFLQACFHGELSIINFLIKAGTNIFTVNHQGNTGLLVGARSETKKIILRTLVRHGLSLHFKNHSGETVLMFAAKHSNPECIGWLIEHGLKVDETDNMGGTALTHVIESIWDGGKGSNPENIENNIRTLIQYGANPYIQRKTRHGYLNAFDLITKWCRDYSSEHDEFNELTEFLSYRRDHYFTLLQTKPKKFGVVTFHGNFFRKKQNDEAKKTADATVTKSNEPGDFSLHCVATPSQPHNLSTFAKIQL